MVTFFDHLVFNRAARTWETGFHAEEAGIQKTNETEVIEIIGFIAVIRDHIHVWFMIE